MRCSQCAHCCTDGTTPMPMGRFWFWGHRLCPLLDKYQLGQRNSVVVMDNASVHASVNEEVKALVHAHDACLAALHAQCFLGSDGAGGSNGAPNGGSGGGSGGSSAVASALHQIFQLCLALCRMLSYADAGERAAHARRRTHSVGGRPRAHAGRTPRPAGPAAPTRVHDRAVGHAARRALAAVPQRRHPGVELGWCRRTGARWNGRRFGQDWREARPASRRP